MRDRLSKADWLRAGLQGLASNGPAALRVVPLAAKLGISRGSFYWHFRDIADFKKHILASWRTHTTDWVIRDVEARGIAPDRLKALLRRAMIGQRSRLDQAVRSWAIDDPNVARAVAASDASRIDYISKLLVAAGVSRVSAASRAAFLYWAYLGQAAVVARFAKISFAALDELTALFERRH